MRKLSMLLLALVGAVVFTSCSDSETYADQKKKERSAINSYIAKNGIKVISEDEFFKDSLTDTTKNEFVLFESSGVYMQIIRKGCGEKIKDGENATVLCRFTERNLLTDSLQLSNDIISYASLVDKMNVKRNSGTFTASFDASSSVMYSVYGSTSVPSGWLVPLAYIKLGRYKLEVGHPPGAPFFMLTANLFSHFASDPSQVAKMVNTMSALLSATTILFLFWSITHLTRRLIMKDWSCLTTPKLIAIEASGLVGALIYTFSDTFWFSAVEGEVYAYSSAFTAIVFWLILKWEDKADEAHSDRWLVLIAYMTGLSIGVHLLNLLCIPAIVLVYCYRRFPNIELKGSLIALIVSFVIVAAVLYGVVPGIITVGGWFELFFVNTLGCPFNTGEVVYIFLLVATVIWAIYETYTDRSLKRQNLAFVLSVGMLGIPFYGFGWSAVVIGVVVLVALWFVLGYRKRVEKKLVPVITARVKNTALLCMLMLMIGYSSYAVIVIRSTANPPMDQNSPEDIFTLGSYLSRDQYGDRPLVYGQAYTSQVAFDVQGNMCIPKRTKGSA